MDYRRIYNNIIENSKSRTLSGYSEKHHIIPRCLGGLDDNSNIAILTAREHYVCHQLLVKLYPSEYGLVNAAHLMCYGANGNRVNNRLYEWLRIKFSEAMSIQQLGVSNSQYGTMWINNGKSDAKIEKAELSVYISAGWVVGRVKQLPKLKQCKRCGAISCTHHYCTLYRFIPSLIEFLDLIKP